MSALFKAGASLTPSPVIATTCFCIFNSSTNFALCAGSTRLKIVKRVAASDFSRSDFNSSKSTPCKLAPSGTIGSPNAFASMRPICEPIDSAVVLLSPVTMTTRMPAPLHVAIARATSALGGSAMPTKPRKVKSFSSSAVICVCFAGIGRMANAKTRKLVFAYFERTSFKSLRT